MNICPTCGKDKLRQVLSWQLGRFVPYAAIEDFLWGGNKDGGPFQTKQMIYDYTRQLRQEGHMIETWTGVGLKMHQEAAA